MLPTDSYRFETQFKVAWTILFRQNNGNDGLRATRRFTMTLLADSPQFASLGRSEHAWKKYRKLTKLWIACRVCMVWLKTRIRTDKKLSYLLRTKVSVIQTLIITNVFIISTRLWNERIRRLCIQKWSEILKISYLSTSSACLCIPSDLSPAKFLIKMMFSQLSLSLWSNYSSHY